jgi:glycolate oxidase FAD binding subunit
MDPALAKLAQAVPGADFGPLEEGACSVDGVSPGWALQPGDGDELARAVSGLRENGLAALVRGGGNRLELGNPPTRADVLLATDRLAGILELDGEEGVCHALAGTELTVLRAAANEQGWELPLDAPGTGSTLGGVIAAAAVGPRALHYGGPRDVVLGLGSVLGTGERTRCGGRVVKNVTGYDLAKLYVGSLGTLCVIEDAWLRLLPLPECVSGFCVDGPDVAAAFAQGLAASRRASARAVVVEMPLSGETKLVIELAGQEATVRHDGDWLERELGARTTTVAALDTLRARQHAKPDLAELCFRFGTVASELGSCASQLATAGASVLAYPGRGHLQARFPAARSGGEASAAVEFAFGAVAELAKRVRGEFALEAGPASAKAGRDVFGDLGGRLALHRALKAQFDPDSVLNPGRMAGRI